MAYSAPYTTVLLKEGCSLLVVSRSLGHKKAAFTADVYADEAVLSEGLTPDMEGMGSVPGRRGMNLSLCCRMHILRGC